ncbi:MAG TPA: endo-1,4-beta-xylanase, partial [Candidatus Nocardiopsis merdipullorum]|nr:endo-1,4-beta-xylanase [Candidatus Nocardiopsis merdipullorum]
FTDLGLEVMLTELDVRVPTPADETDLQQQAEDYREVFEICLDIPGCSGVTVWGVTDAYSWVPGNFEGEGAALPIDEDYDPKPAYWAIHEALGENGNNDPIDRPTQEPTASP